MNAPFAALPTRLLMSAVRGYQLFFSAWIGGACRFTPSCSVYAIEALGQHGALAGGVLAARRVLRCRPGCAGGHDPVPRRTPFPFSRAHGHAGSDAGPASAERPSSETSP